MSKRIVLATISFACFVHANVSAQDLPDVAEIAKQLVTDGTVFCQKPEVIRNGVQWSVTPADVRQYRPNPITALEYLLDRQIEVELYRKYLYTSERDRLVFSPHCDRLDTKIETARQQIGKLPAQTPERDRLELVRDTVGNQLETIIDAVSVVENLSRDSQFGGAASSIAMAERAEVRNAWSSVEFMPLTQWNLNKQLPAGREFPWVEFGPRHDRLTGAFRFRTGRALRYIERTVILDYDQRVIDFARTNSR